MKYIDVKWLHSDADFPVRLVSEIGPDDYECRKVEFWADGRVGYASETAASQDTRLGDVTVPPLEEINASNEFRGIEISAGTFEEIWQLHVDRNRRLIECVITFRSESDGGRETPLAEGSLSGNLYRPHLVVGDPDQRLAFVGDGNQLTEEYIGIAFHDGPRVPSVGSEMTVQLTPLYSPHPMYEKLKPDVTFTIREGARIVGYGRVLRLLE